jgi:hypothetical protein
MSTDKGESDLDVFNDLKPQTLDGKPITETKKTLMGLQAPEEGEAEPASSPLPPVPGYSVSALPSHVPPLPSGLAGPSSTSSREGSSRERSIPPPPPSQRPKRSGAAPPLPPPSRPSGAAPSLGGAPFGASGRNGPSPSSLSGPSSTSLSSSEVTPVTPASVPLPAAARPDEEDRGEDTNPGSPPESSPEDVKTATGGLGLDSWATTAPSLTTNPRISVLPSSPPGAALPEALAAAAAPAAAGAAPEVGWDDDDDKTTIYDKDTQAAAQSLLQPVPGLSGRPPPPMSRPPGAIMPPGMVPPGNPFATRTTAPPVQDASFVLPAQPAPNQRLPYVFALAGAVLVALLIWMVLPKKGSLTVTVAGGIGNKAPAAVEVIVDNKVRCRESPCEIPNLKAGTHYVEVKAAGYQATAKSAVAIVGDQTAVHNVQLIRAGTGIKVFGEGSGLTLLVDGNEFGPLPQELREMEPGEHVIQVAGGPRYEVFQQRIVVDPDRMTPIGPVKLKVTKGLATIRAGANAQDAEVTLRVGDSRRVLPALPVRLEVETDKPHVLIARRKGFATFEQPITFEDGQAEKTIEIVLTERAAQEDPVRRRASTPGGISPSQAAPRPEGQPAVAEAPSEPEEEDAPPADAKASLNLTSTPPSNVLLDGKPLGTTPLRDIQVEPGTHRVIFIHGAERKPKTVDAAPGSKQTVSVSF